MVLATFLFVLFSHLPFVLSFTGWGLNNLWKIVGTSSPSSESNNNECDLYLAPTLLSSSHIKTQYGIFAGKNYSIKSILDINPTIIIPRNFLSSTQQLSNYIFSSNDPDYLLIILGYGMLFNHQQKNNLDYRWSTSPIPTDQFLHNIYSSPFTQFTHVTYYTLKNIQYGNEIYLNYQNNNWFQERNIHEEIHHHPSSSSSSSSSSSHTSQYLQNYGHCLTNIYLNKSSIPLAGYGIYSKKDYRIGDIISISPVVILSKSHIEQELLDNSILYNYIITSEGSDIALLLLGLGAMINHVGEILSNIRIDWYHWDKKKEKKESLDNDKNPLTWNIQKLFDYLYSPLDIQYIATKNIQAGEELFLNYGIDWEKKWKQYLDQLQNWQETRYDKELDPSSIILKPQFRAPIMAPKSLFPSQFYSEQCTRTDDDGTSTMTCERKISSSRSNPISLSMVEMAEKSYLNYTISRRSL